MNNWDSRYAERVKLLIEILPAVAAEKRFALKGGTAINLFERDLPRLSVDIDLTWLPVGEFASDAREISAALENIGDTLRSGPLRLQVQTSGTDAGIHRLIASRKRARIQIETTPVMRGTVHPVRTMRVQPRVEQTFEAHFQGMTAAPVTAKSLLDVRARLLQRVSELLDPRTRAFLESIEREAPDFSLIELPHAAGLPAVRRKLANLGQRSAAKRAADYEQLATIIARRDAT